jgi:hypothetical protein
MSKNEFAIYQTYMIVMAQEKIAIERDIEYSILPYYFIDDKKGELFLSVNNQIMGFSLLSGEIRKSYSPESSNIEKHIGFFMGGKTPLFILDNDYNIYELFEREREREGENSSYRKKIAAENTVACVYDESERNLMVVGRDSLNQIRNDGNNNFNIINGMSLVGFARIVSCSFCVRSKTLSMLTSDQLVYQIKNY